MKEIPNCDCGVPLLDGAVPRGCCDDCNLERITLAAVKLIRSPESLKNWIRAQWKGGVRVGKEVDYLSKDAVCPVCHRIYWQDGCHCGEIERKETV